MAVDQINDGDTGAVARGKINAGLAAINMEVTARGDGDTALGGRIDGEAQTRGQADTALGGRIDGEAEARTADLATLRLLALAVDRPGDNPSGFAADPAFPDAALPASMASVTVAGGRALRMIGAGMLTPVALCPVEPGRTVKVGTVVRRVRDTADPAGGAVGLFVAWYTPDRVMMASITRIVAPALAVADGARVFGALVSPDLGDASYVRPPAGAAYLRPFVQTWGDAAVTDVLSLAARPVADVLSPDVDALVGRLNAVEQRQVAGFAAARSRSFIRAVMFGG